MAIGTLDMNWSKPHFIEEEIQVQRKEAVASVARRIDAGPDLLTPRPKTSPPAASSFSILGSSPLGQSLLPLPCPMHPKAIFLSVHLTVYAVFPHLPTISLASSSFSCSCSNAGRSFKAPPNQPTHQEGGEISVPL